ncbi:hypothetical protein VPNG_00793 [Cytospora leucostoma]|uniref:2EXR domain-containing protein n=1 Tax=Cytospora leucostoma TaxID=1230097 RepID=A0A423XMH5_9PEZI|nr:hypothetical protein VPNG_00793 [Cytospora leucostoma]
MADEESVATSEEMVPSHEHGLPQHLAPDAISPATQDKVAAAFQRFSELPKELREMVWEFAVEDGLERVFHAKRQNRRAKGRNRRYYTMSFWNRPNPPGIVHACQESRAIAKKHLSFIPTDTTGNGTWWNPKLDIMYIDQNFEAYWLRRLSQRGWNLAVQRVAIDWRLCLITMTPRHAPVGSPVYELDPCFAFVIVRLLQNYPGVRSVSIFYPEWQHTDLKTPSEETLVKNQPISGLTDITTETNLIGNCLGCLRNDWNLRFDKQSLRFDLELKFQDMDCAKSHIERHNKITDKAHSHPILKPGFVFDWQAPMSWPRGSDSPTASTTGRIFTPVTTTVDGYSDTASTAGISAPSATVPWPGKTYKIKHLASGRLITLLLGGTGPALKETAGWVFGILCQGDTWDITNNYDISFHENYTITVRATSAFGTIQKAAISSLPGTMTSSGR